MKLCKKETALYWFVHSVVWIGIALPTVFFLLRINHPTHEEVETKSIQNETTNDNHMVTPANENCLNYSLHSCASVEWRNSSDNTLSNTDEELFLRRVFVEAVSKHRFTCKMSHENKPCFKKHLSCNQAINKSSVNEAATHLANGNMSFCEVCLKYFPNMSNSSVQEEINNRLKNMSCIAGVGEESNKSEMNLSSCLSPLEKDDNGTCRIPCDWSLMSPRLRNIYYVVMVINFWAALITTVITLATLASFNKMREFPHIVRFYILICSAMYATASLLPLRVGLAKVYCGEERFWNEDGHSTTPTVIEGIISHYFFLAICFWSLCYVINAYSVIIKQAHKIFDKKNKYHLIQFSICSTLPALLVAVNIAVKKPGYKSLFLDRMTSVFTSPVLEYVTFTLPVQIAIGISVSLLWSIIRFVRKVRHNNTTFQSVRPDEDIKGFINAERQFIKLAVLFIMTVAVVLCSEVVITYRNEEYIHNVHEYFECLKTSSKSCPKPEVQIFFLSSVKICGPGFYCLLNFFLLFFNKDTRSVWKKWFTYCYNLILCKHTHKDGSKTSSGLDALAIKKQTRQRSCTLDTNTSLNSLHRITTYSTAVSEKKPDKVLQLETLQLTSKTGSVSPNEDCPLAKDSSSYS